MNALIAGSTGLVGKALVAQMESDAHFAAVHLLIRKPSGSTSPKFTPHITDFDQLGAAPAIPHDVAFCTLGTTINIAGSQAAFRKVDFDYVLAAANFALRAGARHYIVVTAMGANAKSAVFYSRVKGDVEAALRELPFERLTIIRPSMLYGPRVEFRKAEKLVFALMGLVSPLTPSKYRAISDVAVARAMIDAAKRGQAGLEILESDKLQAFA